MNAPMLVPTAPSSARRGDQVVVELHRWQAAADRDARRRAMANHPAGRRAIARPLTLVP